MPPLPGETRRGRRRIDRRAPCPCRPPATPDLETEIQSRRLPSPGLVADPTYPADLTYPARPIWPALRPRSPARRARARDWWQTAPPWRLRARPPSPTIARDRRYTSRPRP